MKIRCGLAVHLMVPLVLGVLLTELALGVAETALPGSATVDGVPLAVVHAAVTIAATALLSLLWTRHSRGWIYAAIAAAKEMGHGSYRQAVPQSRVNELNDLGSAINGLGEELAERVAELTHKAFYDQVTGLPNRVLFHERLSHALKAATRRKRIVAVLFLDLDNFKLVNDSLGHKVGDELLAACGKRVAGCLRQEDTVARFAGDEFTVILEDISSGAVATSTAERIIERTKAPFLIGDRELFVSVSIGIAIGLPGRATIDDLLRDADLAMYRAKSMGKGSYEVYDHSLDRRAMEKLELEAEMRRGLEKGEFTLYYQPIHSLGAGKLTGLEALLRWNHPTRGLIPPAGFLPLAEETGLIIPIGRWALEQACRDAAEWRPRVPGHEPLLVSVNLSPRQFFYPSLVEEVASALESTGLAPDLLRLEITEDAILDNSSSALATLSRLKALGVRLVIDDFGTGYSSLTYLKHFPVDALKIDGSLIKAIGRDQGDAAIVTTLVQLAKTMELAVTGEGIETRQQMEHLQAIRCDEGQGYYFEEPRPWREIMDGMGGGGTATGGSADERRLAQIWPPAHDLQLSADG